MNEQLSAEKDVPARAPIQGEATNDRRGYKPRGSVTWAEHRTAWEEYHRHHSEQSARRIAERGGFGYWEITDLLGHEPTTWMPGEVARPRPTRVTSPGGSDA